MRRRRRRAVIVKRSAPYLALIALLVGVDQAAKAWVAARIGLYESIGIIPGFFRLSHVQNKGAIFGTFNNIGGRWISIVLLLLSLLALGLVLVYFLKTPPSDKLQRLALTLIMTGALGNQIDRIFRGYVIDFLEFHARRFYFPTFNVADSCVTIGAALLIFVFFVRRKPA
jgi:signal peptidase II